MLAKKNVGKSQIGVPHSLFQGRTLLHSLIISDL